MKLFKAILPAFFLTVMAIYARQYYFFLPDSLANAMQYLPVLLMILTCAIAMHFNQTRLVLFIIVISVLYFSLNQYWLSSDLKYALFACLLPLLIVTTLLFKEQGVFSIRALLLYTILVLFTLFIVWCIDHQPEWMSAYLFKNWLPANYFEWTPLPQSALAFILTMLIVSLLLLSKRQDTITATAFALIIAITYAIHYKTQSADLIVLSSASLLLCLIVTLQQSWSMAYIDELTQLPGRRALSQKLQSLVGIYTLAMVDIDFFKKFNDKYGHDTGDEVLYKIANKLSKVTGNGSAYRYGGEEFTIVFTGKSKDQSIEHLENLRAAIAETQFSVTQRNKTNNKSKKIKVKITVSIGVADSIDKSHADETLKQADVALYKAKKKGRNCLS